MMRLRKPRLLSAEMLLELTERLDADTAPDKVVAPDAVSVPVTETPLPVIATTVDPLLWMFNRPSFPPVDFRPEVPDTTPSSEFNMLGILLSFQGRYFGF